LCEDFDFDLNLDSYFSSNNYSLFIDDIISNVTFKNNNQFKIISRENLGLQQFEKIKNSKNISILINTSVSDITSSSISLDDNVQINYIHLVGADGAKSIVRKYLNLETKVTMGLQYLIESNSFDKIKFIFDIDSLDLGYFWIFPHLTGASVGVYFDSKIIKITDAKKLLYDFLIKQNISINSIGKLQAAPISYFYSGYNFDNIYLVGEAAGLTSYFTGEGIPNSITSGSEIGKKLLDNSYSLLKLNKIIDLRKYELNIISKINNFPMSYKKHILSKVWRF
jgi:flavin-dependent dehydrogenase